MNDIFFIIPSLVNIAGWVAYILMMKKQAIQPNPLPWLMSIIILSVSGLSLVSNGGGWSGVMYLTGIIPAIFVLWMSIKYFTPPSLVEYILLLFAIMLLVLSVFVPLVSIYSVSIYYILTYSIFVNKIFSGESVEEPLPWAIWSFAGVLQLVMTFYLDGLAITSNIVIPFTLLILWSLTLFSILVNEKSVEKQ